MRIVDLELAGRVLLIRHIHPFIGVVAVVVDHILDLLRLPLVLVQVVLDFNLVFWFLNHEFGQQRHQLHLFGLVQIFQGGLGG